MPGVQRQAPRGTRPESTGRLGDAYFIEFDARHAALPAEQSTGRGPAKPGVHRTLDLARDEYGLQSVTARARPWNGGSLGVLRSTGFRVVSAGGDFVRHVRELRA